MININADQLISDGFGKKRRAYGGIHAARKTEKDFFVAYAFLDGLKLARHIVAHGVISGGLANTV